MINASLNRSGSGSQELKVAAPAAGLVLKVHRESEGAVNPGTPILEVGDPKALEVVVDVLTTDAVTIREGARAQLIRWGGGNPLEAHVKRVEPAAFTKVSALGVEEQRVNILLSLDAPYKTWTSLGDGFRVEAKIELWRGDNVLKVPQSAVFRCDDDWCVFKNAGGVAKKQVIEKGYENGAEVEVKRGLKAGQQVIRFPDDTHEDGMRIEAIAD